jgi:hypothetical protein
VSKDFEQWAATTGLSLEQEVKGWMEKCQRVELICNALRTEVSDWQHVADVRSAEIDRLRAALREILESFTEPEDDNDILRRARAALAAR